MLPGTAPEEFGTKAARGFLQVLRRLAEKEARSTPRHVAGEDLKARKVRIDNTAAGPVITKDSKDRKVKGDGS